eukprot:10144011-Alexandrium_andersonii.AAC.1
MVHATLCTLGAARVRSPPALSLHCCVPDARGRIERTRLGLGGCTWGAAPAAARPRARSPASTITPLLP